jgi:hypothetical protein
VAQSEEEAARWIVSREAYMGEAEPHKRGFADVGPPSSGSRVDSREQARNREIFMQRQQRKTPARAQDAAASISANDERKTG